MAEATIPEQSTPTRSRSPSPPTTPPVPTLPGPRASALQKLYNDAVAHILKTCSYENFSACFPTPAARVPDSMRMLHAQFGAKLGESMRREFEGIVEERGVVGSLNELDGLVDEARRRKERSGDAGGESVPPHTLPPSRLYLAHLSPSLVRYASEMRSQQEELEAANVDTLARVLAQRKEIESTVKALESVVADLDASVTKLSEGELGADDDELRRIVRDVEGEMG